MPARQIGPNPPRINWRFLHFLLEDEQPYRSPRIARYPDWLSRDANCRLGSLSPVVKAAPGDSKGMAGSDARPCPVVLLTCDMDEPEDTTNFTGSVLSSEGCGSAPIGRGGDYAGNQRAVAPLGS